MNQLMGNNTAVGMNQVLADFAATAKPQESQTRNTSKFEKEIDSQTQDFQGALAVAAASVPVANPQVVSSPQDQAQVGIIDTAKRDVKAEVARGDAMGLAAKTTTLAAGQTKALPQGQVAPELNPSSAQPLMPKTSGDPMQVSDGAGVMRDFSKAAPLKTNGETQSLNGSGLEKKATGRDVGKSDSIPALGGMLSAAGSTTAAAIAGPKPWSRDWVFPENDRLVQEARQMALASGNSGLALAQNSVELSQVGGEAVSLLPQGVGPAAESQGTAREGISGGDEEAVRNYLNLLQGTETQPQKPMARSSGMSTLSGAEFLQAFGGGQLESAPTGTTRESLKVLSGGMNRERAKIGEFQKESAVDGLSFGQEQDVLGAKPGLKRLDEEAFAGASPMAGTAMLQALKSEGSRAAPATVLTGQVVSGALQSQTASQQQLAASSSQRLSSESVLGLGTQIRTLGNSGGEIRIRLKPENLGELHLKVSTQGGQVGLQIQASDEQAKKILEESLGSLKDNLATQNLSLGRVDVWVAQASDSSGASGQGSSQQQNGSNPFGSLLSGDSGAGQRQGQSGQQESQSDRFWGMGSDEMRTSPSAARASSARWSNSSTARSANGRLNVMA